MQELKCLVPKCEKAAKTRGLCHTCYQSAKGLVKKGVTTWEKLANKGLATLKSSEGQKGMRSKFYKAFMETEKKKGLLDFELVNNNSLKEDEF